jgi:glycosyltransferase involved in cell wall biosynthesis
MMLKNEGKTVRKAIESVLPVIDEAIIGIDSKTTDNTEAELSLLHTAKIPVEITKFGFKDDFADIRNKFIEKCNGDFVLVLDGHEYLDPASLPFLEEFKRRNDQSLDIIDFTIEEVNQGAGHLFQQPRLFKKHIRYENAIHNVILQMFNRMAAPQLRIYHDQPEERLQARQKQRKEINIQGLLEKAQDKSDARSMFYIGQTYYEMEDWENAIRWYDKYIPISDFECERYSARIMRAICHYALDNSFKALDSLMGCFADDVQANEHLILLGKHFQERDDFQRAAYYFRLATAVKMPQRFLQIQKSYYTWEPWYHLASCYLKMNYVDGVMECVKKAKVIAPEQTIFDEIGDRVKGLLHTNSKAQKGSLYIVASISSFLQPLLDELGKDYAIRVEEKFNPENAGGCDVIWCEWADWNAKAVANYETDAKKILRLHSYEAYSDFVNHIDFTAFHRVVFVANHTREYLLERLGLAEAEINSEIIPNGVDLDKFSIPENKELNNKIAWAGYLKSVKGAQLLLLLAEHFEKYEFHVAGMFLEKDLEQLFRERKPDNLYLYQWQNDLNSFFEDKTYILSTSIRESNHITVMEGMAAGLKPLVYNWVGAEEIFSEEWVWKSPGNLYSHGIIEINSNFDFYRQFIIDNYDQKKQLSKIKQLVSNLIQERRNGTKVQKHDLPQSA